MATIEYLPITNMTAKVRNRLPSVEPLTYQYHAYQWALELAEHCTKHMEDKTLKDLDTIIISDYLKGLVLTRFSGFTGRKKIESSIIG